MNIKFKTYVLIFLCLIITYLYKNKKYDIGENGMVSALSNAQSYENNILKVDKNSILSHIENLSRYDRVCGSNEEKKASDYLINMLNSYEYNIDIQEFTAYKQIKPKKINTEINSYLTLEDDKSKPGYNTKNIIAKNKNFDDSKKTIYLTAHYDSEVKTSGVIDNSTGVSVVLEIARILQSYKGDINIVPIFFGAEELGLVGSRYFVNHLDKREISNTIGCINIDMVGIKDSEGIIMWSYDLKNKNSIENFEVNDNVLTKMINNKISDQIENILGFGTDAISFYGEKIPAVTLTSKLSNREISYKTKDEQLKSINFDELNNLCENLSKFLNEFNLKEYKTYLQSTYN